MIKTISRTLTAELVNTVYVFGDYVEATREELLSVHPDRGYLAAEVEERYVAAQMAKAQPRWCVIVTSVYIGPDDVEHTQRMINGGEAYVSREAAEACVERGGLGADGFGSGFGPGENHDRAEWTWGRR